MTVTGEQITVEDVLRDLIEYIKNLYWFKMRTIDIALETKFTDLCENSKREHVAYWAKQDYLRLYASDPQAYRESFSECAAKMTGSSRETINTLNRLDEYLGLADPRPRDVREDSYLRQPEMQIRIDTVFHVGEMASPPVEPTGSHEYGMLSVSVHPREWTKIAQLGGQPTYTLRRRDGLPGIFLDIRETHVGNALEIVVNKAIQEGLVVGTNRIRASWYDDELEETLTSLHETREEAQTERGEDCDIDEVLVDVASEALIAKCGATARDRDRGTELALIAEAERAGYDGVWWSERLDPTRLSAPRGGIFQSRVAAWNATQPGKAG